MWKFAGFVPFLCVNRGDLALRAVGESLLQDARKTVLACIYPAAPSLQHPRNCPSPPNLRNGTSQVLEITRKHQSCALIYSVYSELSERELGGSDIRWNSSAKISFSRFVAVRAPKDPQGPIGESGQAVSSSIDSSYCQRISTGFNKSFDLFLGTEVLIFGEPIESCCYRTSKCRANSALEPHGLVGRTDGRGRMADRPTETQLLS